MRCAPAACKFASCYSRCSKFKMSASLFAICLRSIATANGRQCRTDLSLFTIFLVALVKVMTTGRQAYQPLSDAIQPYSVQRSLSASNGKKRDNSTQHDTDSYARDQEELYSEDPPSLGSTPDRLSQDPSSNTG